MYTGFWTKKKKKKKTAKKNSLKGWQWGKIRILFKNKLLF